MTLYDRILKDVRALDLTAAAILRTGDIRFHQEFRTLCSRNRCGRYGVNWTCPPALGPIEACIERARRYPAGILVQWIQPLEDSLDIDGMEAGRLHLDEIVRSVRDLVIRETGRSDVLALGAGGCTLCDPCTFRAGEPCRHPDQALSSLEAYGMDVAALMKQSGFEYGWGGDRVFYAGLVLFHEA